MIHDTPGDGSTLRFEFMVIGAVAAGHHQTSSHEES
jgi:hypothetical protein